MLLWLAIAGVGTEPNSAESGSGILGILKEEIGDREVFKKVKRQKPYLPIPNSEPRKMKRHNAVRHIPKMTPIPSQTSKWETSSHIPLEVNSTSPPSNSDYEILTVMPTILSSNGCDVVIEVSQILQDSIFCRFNDLIVTGLRLDTGKISCFSPKMNEGTVSLSVSFDNARWCKPVMLSVISEESDVSWGVVGFAGIVTVALLVWALKVLRDRQKRRRRKKEASAFNDQESFYIKDDHKMAYRRQHVEL